MKIALDTNVVAYASGANDPLKQQLALEVLRRLPPASEVMPVQVLGELFRVLAFKAKMSVSLARDIVAHWRNTALIVDTTATVMMSAIELSAAHQLSIWDAVVLAASASEGCALLLSEDMQDGFSWAGVTVINPIKRPLNPLLAESLVAL